MNTDPVGDSVCVFSCVENLSAVSMFNARHETHATGVFPDRIFIWKFSDINQRINFSLLTEEEEQNGLFVPTPETMAEKKYAFIELS